MRSFKMNYSTDFYSPFLKKSGGVFHFRVKKYRYSFNGKENTEIANDGDYVDFGARIYDSRLGRWMSCDPLSSRYPFLSPFNFVSNKPIIAIDPDGRKIQIVSDNPEYRLKVFADIQKLTSTKLVLLANGQVIEAHKAKEFPNSFVEAIGTVTKTIDKSGNEIPKIVGTDLVNGLISHNRTLSIKSAEENGGANSTDASNIKDKLQGYSPSNYPNASSAMKEAFGWGKGADATVFYDPENGAGLLNYEVPYTIMNQDGTYGRKPQVGLGHELGHGIEMMNGTMLITKDSGLCQPENGESISTEEIKVRDKYEKPIRDEQGDKERASPVTP